MSKSETPMMQQYKAIKEDCKDCLLLYRLGDFYELFYEDAKIAAKVLEITLTRRGKDGALEVPMCGVPFHAAENYIAKLVNAGFKVAICEQTETPIDAKKRGYKAIVNREIIRILTPGTLIEENLLNPKHSNYLLAISFFENYAISWVDITSGEFFTKNITLTELSAELTRLCPSEILISDTLYNKDNNLNKLLEEVRNKLTIQPANIFDSSRGVNSLLKYFDISSLDSYGVFSKAQLIASGALTEYLQITHRADLPLLNSLKIADSSNIMLLDAATKRNLEITTTLNGSYQGSLLYHIDQTVTSGGARMLEHFVANILTDADIINERLNKVEFFYERKELRENIRKELEQVNDLERSISRIVMNRGGPRDLIIIKNTLINSHNILEIIYDHCNSELDLFRELGINFEKLENFENLERELSDALLDTNVNLARDGGFIKPTFNPRLTEIYNLKLNGKDLINNLRDQYRVLSSISNLKIEENNVIGFYIEVATSQAPKLDSNIFLHRQTLSNVARFSTIELKQLENDLVNANELYLRFEIEIYEELVNKIVTNAHKLKELAKTLAELDLFISLAKIADEKKYTKPIVDNSNDFIIKCGRHPVIENYVQDFAVNDCNLSNNENLWLITGPNMAGKSTYLRQNALITILAQIGSFVPANFAHIGVVDRIFSRIGAADDLAKGHSTFMIEMIEAATIMNQATKSSFIILDEIGRGTATYDGLAIAWSILEYIHNKIKAKTIFATHYHELTNLATNLSGLRCYTIKVEEWKGKIIFMHQVIPGKANRSYGVYVAKLAGIPNLIIKRANEILELFENSQETRNLFLQESKMPLFSFYAEKKEEQRSIEQKINELVLEEITPKQALEILYELKKLV